MSSISPSHTHKQAQTHDLSVCCWIQSDSSSSFLSFFQGLGSHTQTPWTASAQASLCREANTAALHTDFQAIWGFAAGIHDATVHVTGAVAVVAQVIGAAAAAAGFGCASAAWGLRHHHVAKCQELAKQAGQDAVDAAVWVKMSKPVRLTSWKIK